MKQLTTIKHIIFVILILMIILSLFRGNIVEGAGSRYRSNKNCNSLHCAKTYSNEKDCNNSGTNNCKWSKELNYCKCP
jgi:hypothetical protein